MGRIRLITKKYICVTGKKNVDSTFLIKSYVCMKENQIALFVSPNRICGQNFFLGKIYLRSFFLIFNKIISYIILFTFSNSFKKMKKVHRTGGIPCKNCLCPIVCMSRTIIIKIIRIIIMTVKIHNIRVLIFGRYLMNVAF